MNFSEIVDLSVGGNAFRPVVSTSGYFLPDPFCILRLI